MTFRKAMQSLCAMALACTLLIQCVLPTAAGAHTYFFAPDLSNFVANDEVTLPLVELAAPVTLPGDYPSYPEAVDTLKTATSLTVYATYTPTSTGPGSIFSVGNAASDKAYFHIFDNNGTVGYEVRANAKANPFVEVVTPSTESVRRIAFVADGEALTYKLFIDGALKDTKQMTPATYKLLTGIPSIDSAKIGQTMRKGAGAFLFVGAIYDAKVYTTAAIDSAAIAYTSGKTIADPQVEITVAPGYARNELSWGTISGGASYTVRRGETQVALATATPLATGVTALTYSDDTAGTGTRYWYQVDAVTADATIAGVPAQATVDTGVDAMKASALVYVPFVGDDQKFDGTRVVDITVPHLDAVKALTAGTTLIKFRYTGPGTDAHALLALGIKDTTDKENFGAYGIAGKNIRYALADKLVSDGNANIDLTDQGWHTAAFASGGGNIYSAMDGTAHTGGVYDSSKFPGYFNRVNKYETISLGIGGFVTETDATFGNFVGEIEYVLITDEPLTLEQGRLATMRNDAPPPLAYKGKPPVAGKVDHPIGTFSPTLAQPGVVLEYSLEPAGDGNNNDLFAVDSATGVLTTAAALTTGEAYTVVAKCNVAGGTKFTTHTVTMTCFAFEQPYYAGDDTASNMFRIPALTTLADGRIMSAIDAWYGTKDSPKNSDSAVRFMDPATGQWGDVALINNFLDYPNVNSSTTVVDGACFIDPEIVQSKTGRIFVLVDVFSYGTGLDGKRCAVGSGTVTIGGKKYVGLTERAYSPDASAAGSNIPIADFSYYIGNDKKIYNRADSTPTQYSVDGDFNILDNGVAMMCKQKGTSLDIPQNIFYQNAKFHVFRSSFLWLRYSDDNGITWSDAQLLADVKHEEEMFLGTGPGRGIQLSTGPKADRILFAVYNSSSNEHASVIYSDDNGVTWLRGGTVQLSTPDHIGKTSESQMIELPGGVIRMFSRTATQTAGVSWIGYADSHDGGETWTQVVRDERLVYCGNSQLSIINYSKTIDGKPAVVISYSSNPSGGNRSHGVIRVGVINEHPQATGVDRFVIDWADPYIHRLGYHGYSCLAELPNGDIGDLYEDEKAIQYVEFSTKTLGLAGHSITLGAMENGSFSRSNFLAVPGSQITLTSKAAPGYDYQTGTLLVTGAGGTPVVYDDLEDGRMRFTMPEGNVTITAQFKTLSPPTYPINLDASVGGTVTTDKASAQAEETVALTLAADNGYSYVDGSLAVWAGTTAVALTAVSPTTYTFLMPESAVTVGVDFLASQATVELVTARYSSNRVTLSTGAAATVTLQSSATEQGLYTDLSTFTGAGKQFSHIDETAATATKLWYRLKLANGTFTTPVSSAQATGLDALLSSSVVVKIFGEDSAFDGTRAEVLAGDAATLSRIRGMQGGTILVRAQDTAAAAGNRPLLGTNLEAIMFAVCNGSNMRIQMSSAFGTTGGGASFADKAYHTAAYSYNSLTKAWLISMDGKKSGNTWSGSGTGFFDSAHQDLTAITAGGTRSGAAVTQGFTGNITYLSIIGESLSEQEILAITLANEAPSAPPTPAVQYTVTFDCQGATTPASPGIKTVTHLVTTVDALPLPPAKIGHTFGGWFTKMNGGGTAFIQTTPVSGNLTVYAKWTANPHAVVVSALRDGRITADKTKALSGERVVLTVTASSGYRYVENSLKVTGGAAEITLVSGGGDTFSFVMPKSDVIVFAAFQLVPSSGGSGGGGGGSSGGGGGVVSGVGGGNSASLLSGNTNTAPVPKGTKAWVVIPTQAMTPGMVVVIVHGDGTKEIAPYALQTADGVRVLLPEHATIQLMDNRKHFDDVGKTHWASDAIAFVSSRNLFQGTGPSTFAPEQKMSRAMVITVLARLDGTDTTTGDTWYAAAVDWAKANDISDGTALEDAISREQLALMLYRYGKGVQTAASLDAFADAGAISPWSITAMRWAVSHGLLAGKGGTLDPQGSASRAEVATMLMRFVTYMVKQSA